MDARVYVLIPVLIVSFKWHIPVCALFKGRVVDKPTHHMPVRLSTKYTCFRASSS